jgi:hypothetical protein
MIEGISKIKDTEFSFPIMNAKEAMYKVVSVNELSKTNSSTGNWGAVILAQHATRMYMVPEHIVFTIEYDTSLMPTYEITAITSENDSAKISVNRDGVSTPEKFFETIKRISGVINLKY